jgi:hypothetical protein
MSSNDELLYYMLGKVNQERDWDLPQALCATDHCHWQREYLHAGLNGIIVGTRDIVKAA